MRTNRPDPDELLKEVTVPSTTGKLKLYLGMSAGVGKTYGMLADAIEERGRGTDIIAGYIEPHGRAETEDLAKRLEMVPPRVAEYRGMAMREFDLEAALTRKPNVILVDELAHTNAPGSKHEKRWQDVQELLKDGIDVWTTVNVQHLESLKDVVHRITGVEIQETVPDAFLSQADEVELVDIPPEELLQRLREGKIYKKEKADEAAQNFFRKGNLIALRELVLRHTAERVDAQLRSYRDLHSVKEVWPTTERIIVCVAPNAFSTRVVREAARMAQSSHAELIALSIENSKYANLSDDQREHAQEALRIAENVGAEAIVRAKEDIVGGILEIARDRNVTSIVVGKPLQPRWREYVFGSVVDDLIRRSGEINVHVIPGGTKRGARPPRRRRSVSASRSGVLDAVLSTTICTIIGFFMYPRFELSNIIMVYLLGVTWVATRRPRTDAAVAAVLAVLAFDFFFVPPQLTFAVDDVQYVVTFGVMLMVGLLLSSLASRLKFQAEVAADRERKTAVLYELARHLMNAEQEQDIAFVVSKKLGGFLKCRIALFVPVDDELRSYIHGPHEVKLDENEHAVARWSFDRCSRAGAGTATLSASRGFYTPLETAKRCVGVLGVYRKAELARAELDLLNAGADQIALAIERLRLRKESVSAQLIADKQGLRNTLLSSVSHDLRTPLASITGAASAIISNESLSAAQIRELAATISEEAQRLERLIRNVLDVTRIEGGGVELHKQWYPLDEITGSALRRTAQLLGERQVSVNIPDDLPLVKVDGMLLEQLFVNLFENAARHTPPETPLEIDALHDGRSIRIEVRDWGPGIEPGAENDVFKKAYRRAGKSGQGFGLGLAICLGVAQAHGGSMRAENRPGGGAAFIIEIPQTEPAPEVPSD